MKMKKFGALVMAGVMSLSLVTSAFAATTTDVDDVSKATNVAVTGSAVVPTIKVVVPNAAAVVLNPYAMKLDSSFAVAATQDEAGPQVVSAIYNIENQSNVAMKVSVSATAKPATGVTLATKSVAAVKGGNKQAYVALQMAVVNDTSTDADAFDAFTADDITTLVLSSTAATLKTPIELAAGNGSALGSADGVMTFRFTGDTSSEPTAAWKNTDKVDATLAFTFIPVTYVATTGG